MNNDHIMSGSMILIFYQYGSQEYILPIKYDSQQTIELPVYEPFDLDTCYCQDYEKIEISPKNPMNVTSLIKKYAGLPYLFDHQCLSTLSSLSVSNNSSGPNAY